MKSTKWIKDKLENTKKRIDKLESEMDETRIETLVSTFV